MSAQLSDNLENRTAKSGCVTPGNDPTPAVHLNTPAVSCVGLFRPREGAPGWLGRLTVVSETSRFGGGSS